MPNGIIIIDKPEGWTSMDVCAKLRGVYREKRIGHGGTLDPMATGVLPVFVGQATRAVEFAEKGDKEYIAGIQLGVITNTQDTSGEVLETRDVSVNSAQLNEVIKSFVGEIQQIPPMYSAIKINGVKLYELARKGKEVERKPRNITIREIEILDKRSDSEYIIRVMCSKGTYIRTLCHDIGAALSCGAAMSSLRRSMAAGFALSESVPLETAIEKGSKLLRPIDSMFQHLPRFDIANEKQEFKCRNGAAFSAEADSGITYRVYGLDGIFLCLGRCDSGIITSVKNFFGA